MHPKHLLQVQDYALLIVVVSCGTDFGTCGFVFQEFSKWARFVIRMDCTSYCSMKVIRMVKSCVFVSFAIAVQPIAEEKQHIQSILEAAFV